MKTLVALLALVWCMPAFAMIRIEPVVVSVADLEKKGFTIGIKEESGVLPSLQLSVQVPNDIPDERFIRMEFVVSADEVYRENVEAADSAGKAVRTATKEARRASFTVLGKEIKRSYVTFLFKCPDTRGGVPHERHYLLAVSDLATKSP